MKNKNNIFYTGCLIFYVGPKLWIELKLVLQLI